MSDMLTKEEAMRKFGIDDLRTFNTQDFISIMSSMDKMSPEMFKELVAQIPNFLTFAKDTVNTMNDSFKKTMDSDDESLNQIYSSYDLLINSLSSDLTDSELSLDEKILLSQQIRDLIHDKEELHLIQQEKRHTLLANIAKTTCVAAVAIVGMLAGVNISKGNDTPKHS